LQFHVHLWTRDIDICRMMHVGLEWSHGMAYVLALGIPMGPRENIPS
jgi:hypothetical protein